ncbi:MAG: bacteriohopanetetrol glucosamine biosynthesis glycosyltransferase HpnI [Rhizomicrobium sp.]
MSVLAILGLTVCTVAYCGVCYAILSAAFVERFARRAISATADYPPVSILKPLYGEEPGLLENLATFCVQDYPAPVQIVCGVHDPLDTAVAAVERLRVLHPGVDITLVADASRHGSNAKVSNLINMLPSARHNLLLLSDSDIAVPPDYLRRVVDALALPGVGAVTCLYTGKPLGGLAAQLSAMGIDYHFLPNVLTGISLGLAKPCFGSTIALDRVVLEQIGGLQSFASVLADDYEIGRAVRAKGLGVTFPAFAVGHTCSDKTIGEWLAHELRWARTIRVVDPAGHAGSIVTHAIPLALLGAILSGFTLFATACLVTSVAARAVLKWRIDQCFGCNGGPLWLLPLRDVLSFGVFLASLVGGSVEWKGERLRVERSGALWKS